MNALMSERRRERERERERRKRRCSAERESKTFRLETATQAAKVLSG